MIPTPMENMLKKDAQFEWNLDYHGSLDTLKTNMATTQILVFPDWMKEFHVHADAFSIALGVVLVQPDEGVIDHLIYFSSWKLSSAEKNYTMIETRGLVMVYAL